MRSEDLHLVAGIVETHLAHDGVVVQSCVMEAAGQLHHEPKGQKIPVNVKASLGRYKEVKS